MQPGEQQEARDTEIDGILQGHVVDRAPRRLAACLVECDRVLPQPPTPIIGLCETAFSALGSYFLLPRPALVLLHARDGAEAVEACKIREQRREASLSTMRNSAIAAPPDFRRTSTTRNMKSVAVSARKTGAPERDDDAAHAQQGPTAVARRRAAPRELRASAPASGMIGFSISAGIVGVAGEARAPHVADDSNLQAHCAPSPMTWPER